MLQEKRDVVFETRVFAWIALATAAVLLVPLVAMQFTTQVDWGPVDFLVMGALVFGVASLFVFLARRVHRSRRILVGSLCVIAFLFIWAELAVGLFTNLGH